jgi:hypothetical protein
LNYLVWIGLASLAAEPAFRSLLRLFLTGQVQKVAVSYLPKRDGECGRFG